MYSVLSTSKVASLILGYCERSLVLYENLPLRFVTYYQFALFHVHVHCVRKCMTKVVVWLKACMHNLS